MALVEGEVEELLAASIDKCLDNIGRGFKSIFYWSLENRAGIKRIDILNKPAEFVSYLDRMFSSGAFMIKNEMIEVISSDLGIPAIEDDLATLIRSASKL
jgi:hypothetical protein